MPTLQGQGACLTHFYFHSKWNRVENKCWNYWDNIICIKCPFELRDLVMFTKNVTFELVYILTTGTAYWCHSGMMLNSSIFSGSWVKCLLKCCRSWCFLQSGIMCSNWPGVSVRTAAHVCGQRLGLQGHPCTSRPSSARSPSSPRRPRASACLSPLSLWGRPPLPSFRVQLRCHLLRNTFLSFYPESGCKQMQTASKPHHFIPQPRE